MSLLRKDPTRTTTLRRMFIADMNRRMRKLSKDIRVLLVDEDELGLKEPKRLTLLGNKQAWRFRTDAQKVEAFNEWLGQAHKSNLLKGSETGNPWTDQYIESAHKKGLSRAYTDTKSEEVAESLDFYKGTKEQFIKTAFEQPEIKSKIQLLYTRTFQELKGVTATIDQQLSRTLAMGLTNGWAPSRIARDMSKNIASINRKRARTIARTEVIRAHAEGQLDAFEQLGVEEVGVMAEWATAGDDRVCPMCGPLEGLILSVKEARDLIPRHPNCRCSWIPANVGESLQKQQKYSKQARYKVTRKSMEAETGKKGIAAAREASRWMGKHLGNPPKMTQKKLKVIKKALPENHIATAAIAQEARVPGSAYEVINDHIGGSTGAKLVNVKKKQYVMKQYSKSANPTLQAQNEYLANQLLRELHTPGGSVVPQSYLGDIKGKTAIFNSYKQGLSPMKASDYGWVSGKMEKDFVANSWLANWDVAGLSMDNLMVKGKTVYSLDNGGALLFRAQGSPKGGLFGHVVGELDTLRNGTNPSSAKMFGHITDKKVVKLIDNFKDQFESQVGWKRFEAIIDSAGMDAMTASKLKETLRYRYANILKYREQLVMKEAAEKAAKEAIKTRKPGAAYTKVADMRKDKLFTQQGLAKNQLSAVKSFTGNSYDTINQQVLDGKRTPRIKNLKAAINKAPKFEGMSYRGVRHLPPEQFKKWQSGEWAEVRWDAFSSSTVEPGREFGSRRGILYIIKNKGKQGGYVQPISSVQSENELLYNMGAKFRVVGTHQSEMGMNIKPPKYANQLIGTKTHKQIVVLEEVDDVIPTSQLKPKQFTQQEIWDLTEKSYSLQGK